jgi:hypothetical protein
LPSKGRTPVKAQLRDRDSGELKWQGGKAGS